MTIQQLKYAVTIAEVGSLNKAAEILYVAQPSLTNSVRELENEIGITLFNRGARGTTLTNDGAEFMKYACQTIWQYDRLCEKYGKTGNLKKKFGISTQHYSFAVKSFVEMVKQLGTDEYEFAIRETMTRDVIGSVSKSLRGAFMCLSGAEMLGINLGIGFFIEKYKSFADYRCVLAGIFTVGVVTTLIDIGIHQAEKALIRWTD